MPRYDRNIDDAKIKPTINGSESFSLETIYWLINDLTISNILEILEQRISWHLAPSALELGIVEQVELCRQAQLAIVEASDPLE